MKKLMLGILSLVLISASVNAQDGKKELRDAGKAISSFNLDPGNNQDKLKEAIEHIEKAVADPAMANDYEVWQQRGEIYNAAAQNEESARALADLRGETFTYKDFTAPVKALESFKKAMTLAEKKWQSKGTLKTLRETVTYLNLYSNSKLNAQDYAGAYPLLDAMLEARNILVANEQKDVFEGEGTLNQQKYLVGITANIAGDTDRAAEIFGNLYNEKVDMPEVYSNYFKVLTAKNDPKAAEVLAEGRKKYPDNSEILFAEINYFIQQEKFDALEASLKKAIEAEPDNPSVYSALGNVYMNLMQQESEAGNAEMAKEYEAKSISYFEQAIAIDPEMFDAVYSIGSVYFNEGVLLVQKMSKLGMSKEDMAMYDKLDKESKALFEKSLPYFKRSEKMNPNDINTLIALKEIYARNNDLTTSQEFKKRLESVQNGEILKSYFKGKE
ncbi:MAG: hypothetical protein KDC24_04125 [Saprospiraceae bacterium]|nr:hypothetical protein [Saprospiraceae bacterium]